MRTERANRTGKKVILTHAERLFVDANSAWDSGDLETAFNLFTQAAQLGHTGSQVDLGYFFDQGLFVRRSNRKALAWYHKAYQGGSSGGANNIATVYRDLGKKQRMLWWFRRAAEMGDSSVQLDLAHRYQTGDGVPRNLTTALRFYRQVLENRSATKEEKTTAKTRIVKSVKVKVKG